MELKIRRKNLADQASGTGRSSAFFAGWPKILDGDPGPFWVSWFVCGWFSDSSSDSGGGRAVLVLSLLLALLTVGGLKFWPSLSSWDTVAMSDAGHASCPHWSSVLFDFPGVATQRAVRVP